MTANDLRLGLRVLLVIISAVLLALVATACGSAPSSSGSKTIGFVVYDVGVDPWFNVAIKTVQDQAKAAGLEVKVVNGHNDIGQMTSGVDQLITQRAGAILLAPSDPDSMVPAVKRAEAAGIPVVAFSMAISNEAPVTSFVGADDVNIGREQGKLLAEALGGRGNVALMAGILGSGPQLGRSKGIHDELANHPDIKIIEEQPNNWQNDKTISLTQDWLSKYPAGQINGIVAQGPELAAGARLAVAKGRGDIAFIGCDYPVDVQKAIENGEMYGTINQSPALMAEKAIDTIKSILAGQSVEKQVLIGTPPVTKANVADQATAY
jgi:ribose transport system substrate-binding protein